MPFQFQRKTIMLADVGSASSSLCRHPQLLPPADVYTFTCTKSSHTPCYSMLLLLLKFLSSCWVKAQHPAWSGRSGQAVRLSWWDPSAPFLAMDYTVLYCSIFAISLELILTCFPEMKDLTCLSNSLSLSQRSEFEHWRKSLCIRLTNKTGVACTNLAGNRRHCLIQKYSQGVMLSVLRKHPSAGFLVAMVTVSVDFFSRDEPSLRQLHNLSSKLGHFWRSGDGY